MGAPPLQIVRDIRAAPPAPGRQAGRSLLQNLLDWGVLHPIDAARAQSLQAREDAHLRETLLAHRMVTAREIAEATAAEWNTTTVDLEAEPPDPRLIDLFGPGECLKNGFVPWRRFGTTLVLATARPETTENKIRNLRDTFEGCHIVITEEAGIEKAVASLRRQQLVRNAEARVPAAESCRNWSGWRLWPVLLVLALFVVASAAAPLLVFQALVAWATLTLVLNMGLKAAAAGMTLAEARKAKNPATAAATPEIAKMPKVSIMVPLFKEVAVIAELVKNLRCLDYPKELLDILLIVEADDQKTRDRLASKTLPFWIRTIVVPEGTLKTKPRALNYALDFCKGSIIGIYDAEDAPAADQIRKVVRRFHERGPEVACLQGVLDFYNARCNWLSRCFAIEYAAWFRVILPGLERLGLAIPLGGTTLFFRRAALENLGAWDAHNVTEDADIGIRLARHGYRAEILETVTKEEAVCRPLPWIRQRSRWLKGYAMTWAVHMRSPTRLFRDLGARRFFGFQILFLGTLSQFALAPVLWSFWLVVFGFPHPLAGTAPVWLFGVLAALFFLSEILNIAIGVIAVRGAAHRWLIPWVPTLHLYFPLGALAAYKGLWEIISKPFYWDKTDHGIYLRASPLPTPAWQEDGDLT